jgi:divalent metal cation (Fe/Co/Zn/Cd) transporter
VVVLVIVWVGFRLIRSSFTILVDSAQLDPQVITDCALEVDGVCSVHNVRSRGTPDAIAVDLHVKVKPELSVEEGHRLSHSVKDCIICELPEVVDVVIHVEPCGQDERNQ